MGHFLFSRGRRNAAVPTPLRFPTKKISRVRKYRAVVLSGAAAIGAALPLSTHDQHTSLAVFGPVGSMLLWGVMVLYAYDMGLAGGLIAPVICFLVYWYCVDAFNDGVWPYPLAVVILQIVMIMLTGACIGRMRHLGRAMRYRERYFRALTANGSDLVLVLDRAGRAKYVSESHLSMLQREPAALMGEGYRAMLDDASATLLSGVFARAAEGVAIRERLELTVTAADGRPHVLDMHTNNCLSDSAVRGVVLSGRDITERKQAEAFLTAAAFHDSLTGMPNRALLLACIEREVGRAEADSVALLFIDLDGFKAVNDTQGHQAGDQVLCEVAKRIVCCVGSEGTPGRPRGDEFAGVLPGSRL